MGDGEWGMGNWELGIGRIGPIEEKLPRGELGTMGKTCCKILTQQSPCPLFALIFPITHFPEFSYLDFVQKSRLTKSVSDSIREKG